jgi:outer membrane biosynthesis protein TonB
MAEKGQIQQPKVLRIGIVQDKKLIEERLIRVGDSVTIGDSDKNTFQVKAPSVGKRYTLFVARGGRYFLSFVDGMDGKIAWRKDKSILDLDVLKKEGQATRKGGTWMLPLQERHRGKIVVDGITVLFQFVPAPPESARMMGKQDFRPKLLDEDDPVFFGFLALFSAMAAVLMIYVFNTEPVDLVTLEDMPDRFAEVIILPTEPEDKLEQELELENGEKVKKEKAEETEAKEKKPKRELTPEELAAREAARLERKKQDTLKKSKLLAGIIGTRGESSGDQIEDVFAEGDARIQNLQDALRDVAGVDVASAGNLSEKGATAGGGRDDASIGELGKAGSGSTKVGSGPGTKIKARSDLGTIDAPAGEEGDEIRKVVRAKKGAVQYCYEGRLKENPNISGRLSIEVAINGGRVTNVAIEDNTTGDKQLESCVIGKVKSWRFPPEISDTIVLPFSLSAS